MGWWKLKENRAFKENVGESCPREVYCCKVFFEFQQKNLFSWVQKCFGVSTSIISSGLSNGFGLTSHKSANKAKPYHGVSFRLSFPWTFWSLLVPIYHSFSWVTHSSFNLLIQSHYAGPLSLRKKCFVFHFPTIIPDIRSRRTNFKCERNW